MNDPLSIAPAARPGKVDPSVLMTGFVLAVGALTCDSRSLAMSSRPLCPRRVAQPLLAFAPTDPIVRLFRNGLFRRVTRVMLVHRTSVGG